MASLKGYTLKEPPEDPKQQREQNTHQDHTRNGHVKSEILPFHPNITGQVAKPAQFVAGQPDDKPDHYNHDPDNDNVFPNWLHFLTLNGIMP